MMNIDLIAILSNLSQSLSQVRNLFLGFSYIVGLVLILMAIMKLKKFSESKSGSASTENMFVPIAYFLGGSALLFFPSAVGTLSSTAFGTGNVLQYSPYKPHDIFSSMSRLIQLAGVVWFLRGCVLLTHSSQPGADHGPKGLIFIISGIFAMNFQETIAGLAYLLALLFSISPSSHTV